MLLQVFNKNVEKGKIKVLEKNLFWFDYLEYLYVPYAHLSVGVVVYHSHIQVKDP